MTTDPRTVPAALDRLALRLPDHDALITDERSLTSTALRDEVRRAAAALIALGVRAGDRVAFYEEYARADAPDKVTHFGEELLGPTLIAFGTPEQQQRFLPRILDVLHAL